MLIHELIDEALILTNIEAKNKEEALTIVQDALYKNGYVQDTYFKALLAREEEYPTGLSLGHRFDIAMPHTDSHHVKKSGLCIGVLKEPATFKSMENKEVDVQVQVIFMIALNIANKQVELLQELIGLIRDEAFVEALTKLNSEEIYQYIQSREGVL